MLLKMTSADINSRGMPVFVNTDFVITVYPIVAGYEHDSEHVCLNIKLMTGETVRVEETMDQFLEMMKKHIGQSTSE